jgi:hypothetical protein
MRPPQVDVVIVGKSVPESNRLLEKHSRGPRVSSVVNLRVGFASWGIACRAPELMLDVA